MADAVNTIIDAVKEMVQDVGEKVGAAVKDALHVPDNFAPMVQTLKELVTSGQKFASGEGSTEELNGLSTKLSSFSAMVDTLEDGPLKKMVLTLRDQAVSQLKDVKGSEKILKILAVLGDGNSQASTETPSAAQAAPSDVSVASPAQDTGVVPPASATVVPPPNAQAATGTTSMDATV
ncbi:hypothetical protein NSK_004518 [Nannochloropsis salina CCMP1776]|uniref:Uncharacterized protein n=1 Tax=Nannochloropsis salina CCMP1776 TaxID=1027361 RepID=A0A4D9D3F6_9STRA|nr:hypothetical protein NSK_004518 [Nannochloropsis salina CCMP1776]|eukprot:TFJ84533.1 hypothetical protein NSK_004518 [Nannochloropsis salina CCMP1776]